MTHLNLTETINKAAPAIKAMGREEIAKAHVAGVSGVYMIDEKIVRENPGGRIEDVNRDS
ncbi:hypothetical protein [Rhizobium sp.]|jgi:hypothetical protein|uniref:hypothetical protein n=1 Tax=Rhizobium sp. TaxID=391 RepID=UPI000E8B8016|nr:hypothetical protein [Rhizobium sp.]